MKHFGDITKIKGSEVPIVDVVTGGSPCQDLSVAGKRAGLDGERSGLFMEQIRVVKEMREHDRANRGTDEHIRDIRPRYMVWENVPGAFSSNKGKDFQAVLTEISRIVCKDCPDVPLPEKGKWPKSGCLMGYGDDGQPFSIAYRLHDAQFWGVPQRRKRIALVADFGGTSAPEILFERESVSGNTEQGEQAGKETTGATGTGTNPSSYTLKIRGGC
jgi:DNA (cytosine-5)-methyltransferase 1